MHFKILKFRKYLLIYIKRLLEPKKKKVISQKDYLKRYLSGGKKKKEKIKIQKR